MATKVTTVDDYLAAVPADRRPVLQELRRRLIALLPDAEEGLSYQMPTLRLDGDAVVHYAAWKHHLSLYPAPAETTDSAFEEAFAPHRGDKGTARFPYVDPMPYDLIEQMVEHLVEQRRRAGD